MKILGVVLLLLTLVSPNARAYPYTLRTQSYNGLSSTLLGKNNTIGMGGAVVGVPYNISSSDSNPAGMAMTLDSVEAQINKNNISDRLISPTRSRIHSSQGGIAINPSPWGFGIGFFTRNKEQAMLTSPTDGRDRLTELEVTAWTLSVARDLRKLNTSVGVSVQLNTAHLDDSIISVSQSKPTFSLGVLKKFPRHFTLGASYQSGTSFTGLANHSSTVLPGFFQSVELPDIVSIGTAWIPNRFFRVGFTVQSVGRRKNTSTLTSNDAKYQNERADYYRMGASYVFVDYKWIQSEFAAGSYLEDPAVAGYRRRLHETVSLDINPYFFNFGFGLDVAPRYKNLMLSVGIDIVRTARALKIIPSNPVPSTQQIAPDMTKVSADGLPAGLTQGEKKEFATPNVEQVSKIIEDIPARINEEYLGGDKPVPAPVKRKTKKKKRTVR